MFFEKYECDIATSLLQLQNQLVLTLTEAM